MFLLQSDKKKRGLIAETTNDEKIKGSSKGRARIRTNPQHASKVQTS